MTLKPNTWASLRSTVFVLEIRNGKLEEVSPGTWVEGEKLALVQDTCIKYHPPFTVPVSWLEPLTEEELMSQPEVEK